MSAFRTSFGVAAALLIALGASAQSDERGATAPPRALGSPPPSADADPMPQDSQSEPPAVSKNEDQPPDVDTSDLLSDVPESDEEEKDKSAAPATDVAPLPPAKPLPSVQVQTLDTVEGPVEGLLDSSNGGLGENMWSGSSRADIETLLPRLPLASSDSAVRSLAKRLVLTKAEAPPGPVKRALITIRIEKLLSAGMLDEAASLAASGSIKDDPDFARVQANAILSAGRAGDACGSATAARESEGGAFWLELRAYCAAAAGDGATAEITRNILDAQLLTDNAYNVLVDDALSGAKKAPGPIAKPTAMHLFLMRKAGLIIGADLAKSLGTGANLLAMRDPRNPPDLRLAVAERVAKAGVATTAELKAVLDAQVIAPDKLAGAQASAPKLPFLAAQALLRRAAQLESRPGVRAALVHQALVLGDKAGLFETAAQLQADVAASIDAKGAGASQPLIGWALLLAGRTDAAARWLGDGTVPRAVLDLAAGHDDLAQADLSVIAHDLSAEPKTLNANQPFEALVLGSYDALGLAMPADAKQGAKAAEAKQWPGRRPDADAMQKIVQAASEPDRKGEAVLRILDVVGATGPRDLAPDVTIECVRALSGMGLNDAARSLAIHALLLYRPS